LRWRELREQKGLWSFPVVALPGRKTYWKRSSDFWAKPAAELVSECNRQAAFSYLPQAYPGRVLHVRPTKEYARYKRPQLSLNSLVASGVEEFFLCGYPAQILQEPLVRDLAAKLRTCIGQAVSFQSSDLAPPAMLMAA
jgi:hypothetical protein